MFSEDSDSIVKFSVEERLSDIESEAFLLVWRTGVSI